MYVSSVFFFGFYLSQCVAFEAFDRSIGVVHRKFVEMSFGACYDNKMHPR